MNEDSLLQLSELCPADVIRALRDSKPNLALYTHDYSGKPKVRQSDMDMLAYNAARNDFEWVCFQYGSNVFIYFLLFFYIFLLKTRWVVGSYLIVFANSSLLILELPVIQLSL